MKKILYLILALLGLYAALVPGQLVLAAGPAPIPGEQSQGSGTIEILNLDQGFIVIDDFKYRISSKVTVHGQSSGAKSNLKRGMRVRFTFESGNDRGRPVITEIWAGQ